MASRNCHPAAANKGAQPRGGAAWDPVRISAFPESDLFKWVGTITEQLAMCRRLRYKLSLAFPRGSPYKSPTVKTGNLPWVTLGPLLSTESLLGETNTDSPMSSRKTHGL
ncbi:unnamed protein product [Nyctereutes procyonoides]|uniref:(raccoon dog) hypothetical protein n=1 Tax=Nyctereutes procyonoides TaxID=34880 RepID=A0A811YBB0_NYCPR|nr:unnamed protein product [Nyctereutes procyonoides]